ncbi:MAG TPA: DUF937 domain-containing protein [Bacteroidetes bacterium]|nr:DUF937 domain-containing protein [Bacteroidota bacterium]
MNLIEMLTSQMGDQGMDAIGQSLGTDKGQTTSALMKAVPFLVSAMARNTKTDEGANALAGALDRDHDGSILDNLGSLISSPESGQGSGILNHVLGNKTQAVQAAVAQESGFDMAKAGQLLMMAAPMIMGFLGKKKREQGLDAGGLSSMLQQSANHMAPEEEGDSGIGGMIKGILDRDGDGNVMDDIGGLLGSFLGGK